MIRVVQRVSPFVLVLLSMGCFRCYTPVDGETFESRLAQWRQEVADGDFDCGYRVAAECTDGRMVFLTQFSIDAAHTQFYDAATGAYRGSRCGIFPGIETTSLAAVACPEGTVIESLCGVFTTGDTVRP